MGCVSRCSPAGDARGRVSRTKVGHNARRFFTSLSKQPPSDADIVWAESFMNDGEVSLFRSQPVADQRHSIEVARRFAGAMPDASTEAMVAALLHDVGKVHCGLGTFARSVATMVGPHGRRFRVYFDHERLGAELLRAAGSAEESAALIEGSSSDARTLAALKAADNI